jgi:glutaredoxin
MIYQAFFASLAAVLLLGAHSAQAQQYRWIDKDGRVQYTDAPPPAGARDVRREGAPAASKPAAPAAAAATGPEQPVPFEIARVQKDFPVTLYTSPSCKEVCELARGAFNKRGVPFKEVQVWEPDSHDELKRVSGSTEVPTIMVGRSVQKGFESSAVDILLDSAGYPPAGAFPARAQKAPPAPEGFVAVPVEAPAASAPKAGPYDASGLKGPPPKPGQYDPSGLTGPTPKPGQYGVPAETK